MFGNPAKLKKSPSNLRFSGTSASPASIACRGPVKRTFSPFQAIVPDTIGSTPNSARATSVRPEPSTPPMPKTSPLRTEKRNVRDAVRA